MEIKEIIEEVKNLLEKIRVVLATYEEIKDERKFNDLAHELKIELHDWDFYIDEIWEMLKEIGE